jgi:hypothetical protein
MKEWDFARKALDEISVKYDGTPWGATGKYLKNSTVPTYITPGFDIAVTRVRG